VAICGFEICGLNIFCNSQILRFADPNLLRTCNFRKPAIFTFLLTNNCLKCSNSNFYQIKNSAKRTCFNVKFFLSYGGNLRICSLRTGSPTKFADLQFADQSKEIWKIIYLRKFTDLRLRIETKNLWI
jgi:hypothetical protein